MKTVPLSLTTLLLLAVPALAEPGTGTPNSNASAQGQYVTTNQSVCGGLFGSQGECVRSGASGNTDSGQGTGSEPPGGSEEFDNDPAYSSTAQQFGGQSPF
jgi:hypothetical protein